jgi:hypothetical protein
MNVDQSNTGAKDDSEWIVMDDLPDNVFDHAFLLGVRLAPGQENDIADEVRGYDPPLREAVRRALIRRGLMKEEAL